MKKEYQLVGQVISEIRKATEKELESEGWEGQHLQVIVLKNGVKLYPSQDEEGNGPGNIFGVNPDGAQFGIL